MANIIIASFVDIKEREEANPHTADDSTTK